LGGVEVLNPNDTETITDRNGTDFSHN